LSSANKLSQVYDVAEDRILIIAEDAEGKLYRLWLTQRLAIQLVGALVKWLESETPAAATRPHALTVQAWEQAAAIAQYVPAAPVEQAVKADIREGLVTSIDLQHISGHFTVVFRLSSEVGLMSGFNAMELRQWLSFLHGLFQVAAWPLTPWPAWFEKPLAAAAPSMVN
jgi:hypothetical protein